MTIKISEGELMGTIEYKENRLQGKQFDEQALRNFLQEEIANTLQFHKSYPKYKETPLRELSALSDTLGLGKIYVKDESYRLGLNSFKGLGGFYAIARYIGEKLGIPNYQLTFERLLQKDIKERLGEVTFASATDGNHGRGVAWAARELGFQAEIYMPKGSSPQRLKHIQDTGAKGYITDWNYDNTVRYVAEKAKQEGWVVVQDTSWEGYEGFPQWIMQGYAALAAEIAKQLGETKPTHLFLQAGVGSFAAAVMAYFISLYKEQAPLMFIVEPVEADCFYQSISKGTIVNVTGEMNTIMAGLACGEPNPFAWNIIQQYAKGAFACSDDITAAGMRVYGNPLRSDHQIISGESGAVTAGLLYVICKDERFKFLRRNLGLDRNARVLLINTEGDTDSEHYRSIVWDGKYPVMGAK